MFKETNTFGPIPFFLKFWNYTNVGCTKSKAKKTLQSPFGMASWDDYLFIFFKKSKYDN